MNDVTRNGSIFVVDTLSSGNTLLQRMLRPHPRDSRRTQ